ncbi:MAG: response regulator [Balneolales bacterium]
MANRILSLASTEMKFFSANPREFQLVQRASKGVQPIATSVAYDLKSVLPESDGYWSAEPKAPRRVLQVEDNAENRFIVHRYLKNDYYFDSVEQGEHALDVLKENNIDIIIMDINLGPGIDGIETARRIRKNKRYEHVAIIAVTANVYPGIKQKCLDAGMDVFLPKPFRKQDLTEAMSEVLKSRKNQN